MLDRLLWTSLLAAACELRGEGSRKKVPSWIRVVNKSAFRGKRGGIRSGRHITSAFCLIRFRFSRVAYCVLCRSHFFRFGIAFWVALILHASLSFLFAALMFHCSLSFSGSLSFCAALMFIGSLSFFLARSHFAWPALIVDASLSFFFAALIFLCRYHFLWFALVFLARSCFDSSVLAALKMQPPRSWISKTCLGSTLGGPILILVAAIILALSRSPRSISKREKAYFDIWILGRTWCVWFRIGSGVVTGSTAVC